MKSLKVLVLISLTFLRLSHSYSQNNTFEILQKIAEAHTKRESLSYKAEMYFKDMGSDSFELRNFNVSYRQLPGNPTYGYDWKVEEISDQGILGIMAIADGQYWIFDFDTQKTVVLIPLPTQLETGAYDETMRYYFIMEKILEPFFSVHLIPSQGGTPLIFLF